MQLGYVVLYVADVDACTHFWVEKLGGVLVETNLAGEFKICKIGFAGSVAGLELVPKALMKDNPDGLDLSTPSICFYVRDAAQEREKLASLGVNVAPIREHFGKTTFAFQDNEDRWFAVMQSA